LLVEVVEGPFIQPFDARFGMEADLEENLVRIDIADTGENPLVHQRCLEPTSPPFEPLPESGEVQVQWIQSQLMLFDIAVRVIDQVYRAEQPLVIERQMVTVAERDQDPGVGRLFDRVFVVRQGAGHPEVQQQPRSVTQVHEQVLAVTSSGLEFPALEPALQPSGGHAAEDLPVLHLDHLDVLVQGRDVNVSFEDL
jgi:hypothetical protein